MLIDTGWNSEESYNALNAAFKQIGFSVSEVRKIIVSHLHPDHFGLATRIKKEAPQSALLMHKADADSLKQNLAFHSQVVRKLDEWLIMHGVPSQAFSEIRGSSLENISRPSQPDVLLEGGELLKVGDSFSFEVISTPGHTIGQICMYDRGGSNLIFSGDHVLPTITPNISLSPIYNGDPLGDYLNSLEILRPIKASRILPSHEHVFENLQKRIDEIEEHHRSRLQNTLDVVNSGKVVVSGYDVATKMRWYAGSWEKLSTWEKRAAVMETLAHLEHLKREKRLVEVREMNDGDIRIYYKPVEN